MSQIPKLRVLDQTEEDSKEIGPPHLDENLCVLDIVTSKRLSEQYSLPIVDEKIVTSWEEILSFKDEKSFPLVLKGITPNITTKQSMGLL